MEHEQAHYAALKPEMQPTSERHKTWDASVRASTTSDDRFSGGLSDQWCKWRFHDQLVFVGIRSAKVIAKAFRAGFHLVAHRV